jgi:hypothetical protein
VTPELGEALWGIVTTIAPTPNLPEIVVYSEPDGAALPAAMRLAATDDPAENESAMLALAQWAGAAT